MRHWRSISGASSRPCAAAGAGPARCAMMAMTGEAISARRQRDRGREERVASIGAHRDCGDDSSSTGSSVQADIDHSEVISVPASGAAIAGSNSGAQNADRRQAALGLGRPDHVGERARGSGRAATSASSTGTAT